MLSFPDHDQIHRASLKTGDALGMSVGFSLSRDDASVFLKYLLLEGLDSGERRFWRLKRRSDDLACLRQRLEGLLTKAQYAMRTEGKLPVLTGAPWDAISHVLAASPYYRRRLIDFAMEAVFSEPLAPELCLQYDTSTRHDLLATLPGSWHHAVIFASPLFFANEFYPLAVDAFDYDSEHYGTQRTNVLGAHTDWLTPDGKLERMLFLDFDKGRLVETDVEIPIQPDSVHFLCLGHREQEKHQAISERINCFQLNPFAASRLADDKAATLSGWSALGLELPAYQEISPGDLRQAFHFLNRFKEIVVKPNSATEGELVAFFQRSNPQTGKELRRHLERCWEQGEAIVQQRCDGVCFRDSVSGKTHTLALRFNLSMNRIGNQYLESGYAQVGQDEQSPATCGQGGRIIAIDEALSGLSYGSALENKPIRLDSNDWNRIRELTKRAASLFEDLLLIGLDVLLDHDSQGKITPVFLEANPRPAGLSHSKFLTDDPLLPAKAGVSLNLWGNIGAPRYSRFA